jgi:hypothetical protein
MNFDNIDAKFETVIMPGTANSYYDQHECATYLFDKRQRVCKRKANITQNALIVDTKRSRQHQQIEELNNDFQSGMKNLNATKCNKETRGLMPVTSKKNSNVDYLVQIRRMFGIMRVPTKNSNSHAEKN